MSKYANLLQEWDVVEEQRRSDFLDYLYDLYGVKDGCYTGLWQAYVEDISIVMRDLLLSGQATINVVDEAE